MTKEELININGIREDLYQAMQIGDITLSSKNSQKLVDFMNYQDKEIERLNKQLQLISDEFLKYDWENSSKEQIIFQLKNLYNFIFIWEAFNMSQNIDFDRLKYSLTGEYEEVVLEKQLKEKETQQKEFIKYLEKRYKDIIGVIGSYGSNTDMLYGKKDMIKEILQKYKETIGDK